MMHDCQHSEHIHVQVDNADDIAKAERTVEVAASHFTASTFSLPVPGPFSEGADTNLDNPVQILQLDPLRKRAIISLTGNGQVILAHSMQQAQSLQQNANQAADEGCLFQSPDSITVEATAALWAVAVPASQGQSTATAKGSVTSPGAPSTNIVTLTSANLPAGTYQVTFDTYLDGTIAAGTDDDNIKFVVGGGGPTGQLIQPAVAGNIKSTTAIVTVNGAQSISLQTIAAGTVASVYHGQITATPYPFPVQSGNVTAGTVQERRDQV